MDRSRRKATRIALVALAALLTCAGVAYAAVGLTNASFEEGVDATGNPIGWDAKTVREIVYDTDDEATEPDCSTPEAARRSVCIVETDSFTADGTNYTVSPIDGTKMARLGGPFNSASQDQALDRYILTQQFEVDPANPVLKLNYNIFTFDYSGFDELRFNVRMVDEEGDEIGSFVQGAFGSGTALKSTGWQSGFLDLTGYENQTVTLVIDSGGTSDNLYGFWAYVDAGEVPVSPIEPPTAGLPEGTEFPDGWGEEDLSFQADPNTGQTWITIPNSLVGAFDGCMPLDISLPIDPGTGTISNVSLILDGSSIPMTDEDGDDTWLAHITCVKTGTMLVQYTLTETIEGEEVSQTFLIPIGGLTLIDPAGIVFDLAEFDALNTTPDDESDDEGFMLQAAIEGATVRLQKAPGEEDDPEPTVWSNVLSGDPGISPKINPQITGSNGRYAWDVEEGWWRVVVSADGYQNVNSKGIWVPPEVTDLHIPMVSTTTPPPPDSDGDGVPDDVDQCDDVTGPASNNGCPIPPADGDGDGVPDSSDACPTVPGGGTVNGCPVSPPAPTDTDGDGVADASDQCPTVKGSLPNGCNPPSGTIPGPKTGPCEGLTGTKLADCNRAEALKKKLAKCNEIKKKAKRKTCVKKAKALSKCSAKSGKKKKACVKKAKKIGAKKKGSKK